MSLYADYARERLGKTVLDSTEGFVMFWLLEHAKWGPCVYIEDIYVVPAARRRDVAKKMADQVCAAVAGDGATTLLGSVDVTTFGATASLEVLIAYGMTVYGIEGNLVMFKKDIMKEE